MIKLKSSGSAVLVLDGLMVRGCVFEEGMGRGRGRVRRGEFTKPRYRDPQFNTCINEEGDGGDSERWAGEGVSLLPLIGGAALGCEDERNTGVG